MPTSIYGMDKIKNGRNSAKMYDLPRGNGLKLSFSGDLDGLLLYLEYNIKNVNNIYLIFFIFNF